jgi:hypothetical protein
MCSHFCAAPSTCMGCCCTHATHRQQTCTHGNIHPPCLTVSAHAGWMGMLLQTTLWWAALRSSTSRTARPTTRQQPSGPSATPRANPPQAATSSQQQERRAIYAAVASERRMLPWDSSRSGTQRLGGSHAPLSSSALATALVAPCGLCTAAEAAQGDSHRCPSQVAASQDMVAVHRHRAAAVR